MEEISSQINSVGSFSPRDSLFAVFLKLYDKGAHPNQSTEHLKPIETGVFEVTCPSMSWSLMIVVEPSSHMEVVGREVSDTDPTSGDSTTSLTLATLVPQALQF